MSKLEELIAELEKAAGPSRDFDWRIAQVTNLPEVWPETAFWPPFMAGSKFDKAIPLFTASIDAAVALEERVKPGWFWRGGNVPSGKYERGAYQHGWGHISRTDASNCDRDDEFTGWASTPAIALCIAALKAKLSQMEA